MTFRFTCCICKAGVDEAYSYTGVLVSREKTPPGGFPVETARFCNNCDPKRLQAGVAAVYAEINAPEVNDFVEGVVREAAHQRTRWGFDHDNAKLPEDWFWTVGRVLGKAMWLTDPEKRLHHLITAAAIMLNWHLYASGKVPNHEKPE